MQLFSTKTLGLYALAIGCAVVLFQVVTSYGEANVIAPSNIAGKYRLDRANLPPCLSNKQTSIDIQQSGIYLNASLTDAEKEPPGTKASPTLAGRFYNRQIDLSGTIPTAICPQSQLKLVATISPENAADTANSSHQLQGKLWLTTPQQQTSTAIPFTAIEQAESPVQSTSH